MQEVMPQLKLVHHSSARLLLDKSISSLWYFLLDLHSLQELLLKLYIPLKVLIAKAKKPVYIVRAYPVHLNLCEESIIQLCHLQMILL